MFNGLIIAALLISITPAIGCTPKLALGVKLDHAPPVIRSTYDLNQIRALAAASGQPLHHEAFGFYIATFGYEIKSEYDEAGRSDCGTVAAQLRLFLENRTIEIASDLEGRGCRRDFITAHYMLHARNDDKILALYADRLTEALRTRFDTHSVGDPRRDDVRYVAKTAIKEVVDNVFQSFSRARETAAAAADNDQELKRLASACTRSL